MLTCKLIMPDKNSHYFQVVDCMITQLAYKPNMYMHIQCSRSSSNNKEVSSYKRKK